MTDIEKKALALLNEVAVERGYNIATPADRRTHYLLEVACRAIEQHEAFRQEVSDAVERAIDDCGHDGLRKAYIHARFFHFIIAKPDPLAECLLELDLSTDEQEARHDAECLVKLIEKRHGKLVWGEG